MERHYLVCIILAVMLLTGCAASNTQLEDRESAASPDKSSAVLESAPENSPTQPAAYNLTEAATEAEPQKQLEQAAPAPEQRTPVIQATEAEPQNQLEQGVPVLLNDQAPIRVNNREQEAADYKLIKDQEKNTPYAGLVSDDYVRVITLDELACRVAAVDKFLADYPASPHKDEMTKWRDEYLHDYLFGNFKYTSSFQWMDGSNKMSEEYLKSYADAIIKYKGTAFAALLEEYTTLLKHEGNKMSDKVRAFVAENAKDEQVIFKLPE